jgi:GNAT superfamily N-acetyltransferase
MNQITSMSADELHVSLKVPRYAAKEIFRWAREQQWPEGTQLEDFNEYHCTLLYSPNGYQYWSDAWFIPKLEVLEAQVVGFDNFGDGEGEQVAYVLRLHGEDLQAEAEKLQSEASHVGVIDNFLGAYKPHITIGYGPVKVNVTPPDMLLDLGPVEVSPPRLELTDTPSLEGIAKDLHQEYQDGTSPTEIVMYAANRLNVAGFPDDDITIQAALESWQILYPEDVILQHTAEWAWNSGFEHLIDQYSPHGLSCLYDETPNMIDISHIEVDPARRNTGIGSKFMEAAHQYAQSVGKQLNISRVDNAPFFNKFPFLQQQDAKTFVTASIWDETNNWRPSSLIAAQHSSQNIMPNDHSYYHAALNQFTPNPNSGVHKSFINTETPNQLYIKPEQPDDYHRDSPIKERGAFILGNAMGMNVPQAVVRPVVIPQHQLYATSREAFQKRNPRHHPDKPIRAYASVHHGVPNSQTLEDYLYDQGIYSHELQSQWMATQPEERRKTLLFDQVIGNQDRHSGNLLIDNNNQWHQIDHGGAFRNVTDDGADHFFFNKDFYDQPLTNEERQRVQAARQAIDNPKHSAIFSHPDLHPKVLNQRINTLLNTGKFITPPVS